MSQTLAARKRASPAQLLFRCARRIDERAVALIRDRTGRPIRPAHTHLLPHIAIEGTRITAIAAKLGVSKQAVAPLVDELVAWGLLEKAPDPSDARAKVVRFSRGGEGILDGLKALGEIELVLQTELGEERWSALHGLLVALDAALDAPWLSER
jgi:DNA-binding MarR family transcriptional regulator